MGGQHSRSGTVYVTSRLSTCADISADANAGLRSSSEDCAPRPCRTSCSTPDFAPLLARRASTGRRARRLSRSPSRRSIPFEVLPPVVQPQPSPPSSAPVVPSPSLVAELEVVAAVVVGAGSIPVVAPSTPVDPLDPVPVVTSSVVPELGSVEVSGGGSPVLPVVSSPVSPVAPGSSHPQNSPQVVSGGGSGSSGGSGAGGQIPWQHGSSATPASASSKSAASTPSSSA